MKKTTVVSGAICAAGVLLLAGGCKSQVMADRTYVPLAEEDKGAYAQFSADTPAPVEDTPAAVAETAPAAPAAPTYPSFESFAGPVPTGPAAANANGGKYVVKKGDIIVRIARKHGVSPDAVLAANNMTLDDAKKLKIGQTLVIPAPGTQYKKAPVKKSAVKKSGKKAVAAAAVTDGYYTVKAGDNIPKIARRLKVKSSALMEANNLDEAATRRLQIGQKLVVPGAKVTASVKASDAAPAVEAPAVKPVETVSEDALSAVDNALNETAVQPAAAPATAAPAPVVPAADDVVLGGSVPALVKEAVKLEDFVKTHNITADVFKKLNGDIVLTDGMIPAGSVVFVPAK